MFLVPEAFAKFYHDRADHRSDDWFLMGSPWPVLCIAASYVYFVTNLGPRFMKNRSAFHVDPIVRVYNLLQIFLCLCLFIVGLNVVCGRTFRFICQPVDYSNTPHAIRIARLSWMYFLLKVLDLCDTVFFILRKKSGQVSFLHMYHHMMMLLTVWTVNKFCPGGHASFVGITNCFVHVVMYSYYFVTSAWPEKRNGLWWKKHITQLQMAQFAFLGLHSFSALLIHNCEYPFSVVLIFVIQNVVMFNLFYNFYRKAYSDKKER